MNNGSKAGIHADMPEIAAAYGEEATKTFNAFGAGLFGKMAEFKMDPQTIADGVLALVNMEKGTRPLRYPLDAIAQGADQEFINSRAEIKTKWQRTMASKSLLKTSQTKEVAADQLRSFLTTFLYLIHNLLKHGNHQSNIIR